MSYNTYVPDDVGNRQSVTDSYGQRAFSYDDTYQLTQATNPTENFAYDPVGKRLSDGTEEVPTLGLTYIYDYENNLIQVKNGETVVADYKYDPFGRRIKKTDGSEITWYVYDGPNILTEYTETGGNWVLKNAYAHTLRIDDPLSIQQGGNHYYYLKDGLGSITGITNSSGSIVEYLPVQVFRGNPSQTGALNQPFAFTGREFDSESGLYFYRARYYDPKQGRFLTKDPIGFAGGDVNLYRYVQNNPVNFIDPSGELIQFIPYLQRLAPYAERAYRVIQRAAGYIQGLPRAGQAIAEQASNAPTITRGLGNITHACGLKPDAALSAAQRWLGSGYREIYPGVFRSTDNLRQFRMVTDDLLGAHGKLGPHIHFEALNDLGLVIENLHVPLLP